jgi:HD-GYP domain-containing protein (c-di-GMP phosphodiesterase class II)
MQAHTTIGARMLAGSQSELLQVAEVIALSHHERWGGGGYPQNLRGEQIPLPARLVALADVVDALSSDRPYRRAWPFDQVREHVEQQAGVHFDPAVVSAYRRLLEQHDPAANPPAA